MSAFNTLGCTLKGLFLVVQVLFIILLVVSGIAIYHSKLQPTGHNPCAHSLCSDECVASYTSRIGYKCICKKDIQLLNDEHTCEDSESNIHVPSILLDIICVSFHGPI
jgi:hypothetical protein